MRPTNKQKKAMEIHTANALEGKDVPWGKVMLKAGFSPSASRNPGNALLDTKGWQTMLAEIDEKPLMDKMRDIALNSKSESVSLKAIKELLLLKGRYPKDGKLVKGAWREREGLIL